MCLPNFSAFLLIGLLASTTRAQGLSLDMAGGLFNEPAKFTVSGGQPGDLWVLCFADTQGPTPIALLDPADPRNWDLDLSMFTYPGFFGTLPAPSPTFSYTNVNPAWVGLHLYAQAFTVPGSTTIVDALSNDVLWVMAPGHNTSLDTFEVPIESRAFAVGARLPNGNDIVLGGNFGALQGGTYLKTSEIYDRKLQRFTAGPNLSIERSFAAAATLDDGRVLVCGGNDDQNNVLASAEIYNPATNSITPTGSMSQARYFHAAVKLADGRVMVFGGSTVVDASSTINAALAIVGSATASAEIYNPATGTWSNAPAMPWTRTGVSAARLPDGKVLVAGGGGPGILGIPTFYSTASRYNPATNAWVATPGFPGSVRALATTTVLSDGRVMLSGGANGNLITLSLDAQSAVSIYDGTSNAWTAASPLPSARAGHAVTLLPSGLAVATGGASGNVLFPTVITAADLWTGTGWVSTGTMNHDRAFHYASVTPDGERVFAYGGVAFGGTTPSLPTAELYAP